MKLKTFALSGAMILLFSVTSQAQNGYFNTVLRNLGYGFSDGYHAGRYCLSDCKCSDCSPMQQPPIIQEQILPEPILAPPEIQQAEIQQAEIQQPMVRRPMTRLPATQWATQQVAQESYPIAYPVTNANRPWYPAHVPGYGRPTTPPVAIPSPRSALHR